LILGFDGNIINYQDLKDELLRRGSTFSGYHDPEEVTDAALISKIIAQEASFEKGIEKLIDVMEGDFAIVGLKREGVYAVRGWGRKPLILGKKEDSFAVSSESNSFINTGFDIFRDVEPGEIVLLDREGIHQLAKFDLSPVKYRTFEWIYNAYPPSVIDGRSVSEVRKTLGRLLAKRYPVEAEIVSPVPNSGRWHAIGFSLESGIPCQEVFARYDYSDRSYTQDSLGGQQWEADTKLIPLPDVVRGNRIVLVDDSIVRGNQTRKQTMVLKSVGAKEIHARVACPPLMYACIYGKTTKKDEDCIARRMSVEEIQETRGLDSLGYATIGDLEKAIGCFRGKLCLECWVR